MTRNATTSAEDANIRHDRNATTSAEDDNIRHDRNATTNADDASWRGRLTGVLVVCRYGHAHFGTNWGTMVIARATFATLRLSVPS
jgi:hypothetical protein